MQAERVNLVIGEGILQVKRSPRRCAPRDDRPGTIELQRFLPVVGLEGAAGVFDVAL